MLFTSFPTSSVGTDLRQKLCFELEKRNITKKMKQELPVQAHYQAGAWDQEKVPKSHSIFVYADF